MRARVVLSFSCRLLSQLLVSGACLIQAPTASSMDFSDIAGWWSAEPTFAGESSRVLLHFLEEDGKQTVRLTLPAIGGFDYAIGVATIDGNSIEMQPYPFALRYDAATKTLSGHLPEAAVPVYRIPVEFRRAEPAVKPPAPTWSFPRPAIAWTVDVQAPVWAGLAYDPQGRLIFVGADSGVLYAIDEVGRVRWKFATGKAIKARPAVIGDALYVASESGFLFKLDKRSGVERWRARTDSGSPERIPTNVEGSRWDRYGSSVVGDASHIYVTSRDKRLYALDQATGEVRWRIEAGDMMTATPALYRDLVLYAAFDGKIQAVRAQDGAPRWSYDATLPVAGDLVVDGDRVFLGSRTYDLIALDARTGEELWKHYYWFSWIESPPVVRNGVVYTGSSDATGVYAIRATDGSRRWVARVPGWAWQRVAVSDDLIVVGTVGQGKYPGVRAGSVVGVDRASGAIRWVYIDPPSDAVIKSKAEWGFGAAPVLAGDRVYAAGLDGKLYALTYNHLSGVDAGP